MANAHIVSVLCAEFGPKLAYVVLKEVLIKFHWDPPCGPVYPVMYAIATLNQGSPT